MFVSKSDKKFRYNTFIASTFLAGVIGTIQTLLIIYEVRKKR